MIEGTYRIWSVIIQAVTAAGVIYGIFSGLGSWEKSLDLEEVRLRNQLLSAFWAKRIEAHIDAAAAAAILARANRGDATWKEAETRFWELYQGRLVVVEDAQVCGEMVNFGKRLNKFKNNGVTQAVLEEQALKLASVIRGRLKDASEKGEAIRKDHSCS